MKLALLAVLLCFSLSPAARADTIYDLTGTATLIGNDACPGQCIETLNFSFSLDEGSSDTISLLAGDTFSSSGPLDFTTSTLPGVLHDPFVGFFDGLGSELDIGVGCDGHNPGPGGLGTIPCVPQFSYAALWSCSDQTCIDQFCPPPQTECSPPQILGGTIVGTITATDQGQVAAPEPGTLLLLTLGLGPLVLAVRYRNEHLRSARRSAS